MNSFEEERQKDLVPLSEDIELPFPSSRKKTNTLPIRNFARCQKCLEFEFDKFCPNYSKCPYKLKNTANTIINRFTDFDEILFYKYNFAVPDGTQVNVNIDRSRKWLLTGNGVLVPKNEDVKIEDLKRTLNHSRKRALDNLYGFINCNEWSYFVTITFKHGKTKKLLDEIVKYQWQKFRQQLQYRFPDIKIILVPEDTPTGVKGMHFHGFMGNADLSEYLRPARNNKKIYKGKPNPRYGELEYTEYGDPVFNFLPSFVNIGFSTIVKIKECNKNKLANYISKYISKDSSSLDYNENSYLRTYNLNFKEKEVCMFTKLEKQNLVNSLFVQHYKETERFVIYRRYKI